MRYILLVLGLIIGVFISIFKAAGTVEFVLCTTSTGLVLYSFNMYNRDLSTVSKKEIFIVIPVVAAFIVSLIFMVK